MRQRRANAYLLEYLLGGSDVVTGGDGSGSRGGDYDKKYNCTASAEGSKTTRREEMRDAALCIAEVVSRRDPARHIHEHT